MQLQCGAKKNWTITVSAQFVLFSPPVWLCGVTTIGLGSVHLISSRLSRAAWLLAEALQTSPARRRWCRGSRQCRCSGSKPRPCWKTCRTCSSLPPGGTEPGWSPRQSYSWQKERQERDGWRGVKQQIFRTKEEESMREADGEQWHNWQLGGESGEKEKEEATNHLPEQAEELTQGELEGNQELCLVQQRESLFTDVTFNYHLDTKTHLGSAIVHAV